MSGAKKASELIQNIFSGISLEKGEQYYSLFSGWERIAGTDISSHSRIKEIEKGCLIVSVDHPGWAQMVQMNKGKILSLCRKEYPELAIKGMRIVLEREGESSSKTKEKPIGSQILEAETLKTPPPEEKKNFKDLLTRLEHTVKDRFDTDT